MASSNSAVNGSEQSSNSQRPGRWAESRGLMASGSDNSEEAARSRDAQRDAIYRWNDGSGIIVHDTGAHLDASNRQHVPLDQSDSFIRLIQLITRDDDTVECIMHIHPISLTPPFVALSYVWGPPLPTKGIILNGRGFDIRENLWTALQSLKHTELSQQNSFQYRSQSQVNFWIDAICIDQENIDERNHQVSIMAEIYQRASRVFVWLGLPEEDSKLAIRHIRSHGRPIFDPRVRDAMLRLIARPYWRRMWIVQEFLLARSVLIYCGDEFFEWSDIYKTLNYHREMGGLLEEDRLMSDYREQSSGWRLVLGREYFLTRGQSDKRHDWQKLDSLIAEWGDQECQDIHDKVYALLGLLPKEFLWERGGLYPDYRKNVEQLALDVLYAAQYTKDVRALVPTLHRIMRILGINQSSQAIQNAMRELQKPGGSQ